MTQQEQITWLVANTAATNTILRALAQANANNPVFCDAIKRLFEHRAGLHLGSLTPDVHFAAYEAALRELLPPEVRAMISS